MNVTYIDHMGTDLTVVNAARVSFNKESDGQWWSWKDIPNDGTIKDTFIPKLSDKDVKLIEYLAKNGHWSPFAHTSIQFRFKAPIFLARQLVKHQVGLVWNEISRRYVTDDVELFWPYMWRKAAENAKQGSSDEEFFHPSLLKAIEVSYKSVDFYKELIDAGCCPEQARMFLPQNAYTEWYWTGSLYAWARVYKQRTDPHAQKEAQLLVSKIDPVLKALFPVSWEALTSNSKE